MSVPWPPQAIAGGDRRVALSGSEYPAGAKEAAANTRTVVMYRSVPLDLFRREKFIWPICQNLWGKMWDGQVAIYRNAL
jgi:hypothetical protein